MEDRMKETYLVYCDESGDDGNNTSSSDAFLLTTITMSSNDWHDNYEILRGLRKDLRNKYGIHIKEEMHTKHFVCDKDPYRKYNLTVEQRKDVLINYIKTVASLKIQVMNVLIDKEKIKSPTYDVLGNSLKYSIQRIENTSSNKWNYIFITDRGRLQPMRRTARAMQVYNPIQSHFNNESFNQPIKNMIEDILDKDSKESVFIQVCDFISYFFYAYYKLIEKQEPLSKRASKIIDKNFLTRTMATFKVGGILNSKATSDNNIGLVVYPK